MPPQDPLAPTDDAPEVPDAPEAPRDPYADTFFDLGEDDLEEDSPLRGLGLRTYSTELRRSRRGVSPYRTDQEVMDAWAARQGMSTEEYLIKAEAAGVDIPTWNELLVEAGSYEQAFEAARERNARAFQTSDRRRLADTIERQQTAIDDALVARGEGSAYGTQGRELGEFAPDDLDQAKRIYSDGATWFPGAEASDTRGEVSQKGEQGHRVSSAYVQSFIGPDGKMAEGMLEIDTMQYALGGAERWVNGMVEKRMAKSGLAVGTDEYEAARKRQKYRAVREIAMMKTVGMWTGPALLPINFFDDDYAGEGPITPTETPLRGGRSSTVPTLRQALNPTIEIIGVANSLNEDVPPVVIRQQSKTSYLFDLIDTPLQVFTAGTRKFFDDESYEGLGLWDSIKTSIARRDNPLDHALESEMFKSGVAQAQRGETFVERAGGVLKAAPVLGVGLATSIFLPDATDVLRSAGRLTKAQVTRMGRYSPAADRQLGQIVNGYGDAIRHLENGDIPAAQESLRQVAAAESELRRVGKGQVSDFLDFEDTEIMEQLAEEYPDLRRVMETQPDGTKVDVTVKKARKLGGTVGERLLSLPPYLRARINTIKGQQFLDYPEKFGFAEHLDEILALRGRRIVRPEAGDPSPVSVQPFKPGSDELLEARRGDIMQNAAVTRANKELKSLLIGFVAEAANLDDTTSARVRAFSDRLLTDDSARALARDPDAWKEARIAEFNDIAKPETGDPEAKRVREQLGGIAAIVRDIDPVGEEKRAEAATKALNSLQAALESRMMAALLTRHAHKNTQRVSGRLVRPDVSQADEVLESFDQLISVTNTEREKRDKLLRAMRASRLSAPAKNFLDTLIETLGMERAQALEAALGAELYATAFSRKTGRPASDWWESRAPEIKKLIEENLPVREVDTSTGGVTYEPQEVFDIDVSSFDGLSQVALDLLKGADPDLANMQIYQVGFRIDASGRVPVYGLIDFDAAARGNPRASYGSLSDGYTSPYKLALDFLKSLKVRRAQMPFSGSQTLSNPPVDLPADKLPELSLEDVAQATELPLVDRDLVDRRFRELIDSSSTSTVLDATLGLPAGSDRMTSQQLLDYVLSNTDFVRRLDGGTGFQLKSALRGVAAHSPNASARHLAQLLDDLVDERTLLNFYRLGARGSSDAVQIAPEIKRMYNAAGMFMPRNNEVLLRLSSAGSDKAAGLNEQTLLHEAVHAATSNVLDRYYLDPQQVGLSDSVKKSVQDLEDLCRQTLDSVQSRIQELQAVPNKTFAQDIEIDRLKLAVDRISRPDNNDSDVPDVYEFLAYGLSDPLLQKVLRETRFAVKAEEPVKLSLFGRFVEILSNIISKGDPIPGTESALDRLLKVSDDLFLGMRGTTATQRNLPFSFSQRRRSSRSLDPMFIGEKGATALSDSPMRPASATLNPSEAKALLSSGIDPEQVRKDTGWFKRADGVWRFEISDAQASLIVPAKSLEVTTGPEAPMTMGDLLDHPLLYEAYPGAADIKVRFAPNSEGSYISHKKGEISLALSLGRSDEDLIKNALHEVQHFIQNIEGMALGGSPEGMFDLDPDLGEAIEAQIDAVKNKYIANNNGREPSVQEIDTITDVIYTRAYRRLLGEVEADDTSYRRALSAVERAQQQPRERRLSGGGKELSSVIVQDRVTEGGQVVRGVFEDTDTPEQIVTAFRRSGLRQARSLPPGELLEKLADNIASGPEGAQQSLELARAVGDTIYIPFLEMMTELDRLESGFAVGAVYDVDLLNYLGNIFDTPRAIDSPEKWDQFVSCLTGFLSYRNLTTPDPEKVVSEAFPRGLDVRSSERSDVLLRARDAASQIGDPGYARAELTRLHHILMGDMPLDRPRLVGDAADKRAAQESQRFSEALDAYIESWNRRNPRMQIQRFDSNSIEFVDVLNETVNPDTDLTISIANLLYEDVSTNAEVIARYPDIELRFDGYRGFGPYDINYLPRNGSDFDVGDIFDEAARENYRNAVNRLIAKKRTSVARSVRRRTRIYTTFSGTGTMEAGLSGATDTVGMVEFDQSAVDAYNVAHGSNHSARSVFDLDAAEVAQADPDYFHASPVCKNFSLAKRLQTADENDLRSAQKVAEIIRVAEPPVVTVENVAAYKDTALYKLITDALEEKGYTFRTVVVDTAEYGSGQSRKRMLLQAVRSGQLPDNPAPTKQGDWYEEIKDLIDKEVKAGRVDKKGPGPSETAKIDNMIASGNLDGNLPIITMGASKNRKVAAARNSGGPSTTLAANQSVVRIRMPNGKYYRATPRMLARLMGMPDDFAVPSHYYTAKMVLGNGMHSALTQNFIEPLLNMVPSIRADNPAFRRWFGDSKVVDEQGEPLVMYHGTTGDFDAFDPEMIGTATDEGYLGRGFYFTNKSELADIYAGAGPWRSEPKARGSVMPAFLRLQNPLELREAEPGKSWGEFDREVVVREALGLERKASAAQVTEAARAQGFDGVVYRHRDGEVETVVFEPTQIKSATGNRGTFDPNDPRINRSAPDRTATYQAEAIRTIQRGDAQGAVTLLRAINTPLVFDGADLPRADFADLDVTEASFKNANLSGARFTGADLSGADFTGADLTDADFGGIKYNSDTKWPEGFTPPESTQKDPKKRSPFMDRMRGFAQRRPDFSTPMREDATASRDMLQFLSNMTERLGVIEDGQLISVPNRVGSRYKNPRIVPAEWIRGSVDDPEIKIGGQWTKALDATFAEWVSWKKWTTHQMAKGYGQNVLPVVAGRRILKSELPQPRQLPADTKEKLVELVKAGQSSQAKALSDALGIPLDLSGADLFNTDLSGADLSGVNLSGVDLINAKLGEANLSGVVLYNAKLSSARLGGANLSDADLRRANLSKADLSEATLSGANLIAADLRFADLRGADLRGVDLSRTKYNAITKWPDGFEPTTVENLYFIGPKSDLSGADLSNVNLGGADLQGADLSGANLSGANLYRADLISANLSGADLSGADLSGVYATDPLRDMLRRGHLDGIYYDDTTQWPDGFEPPESAPEPPVRRPEFDLSQTIQLPEGYESKLRQLAKAGSAEQAAQLASALGLPSGFYDFAARVEQMEPLLLPNNLPPHLAQSGPSIGVAVQLRAEFANRIAPGGVLNPDSSIAALGKPAIIQSGLPINDDPKLWDELADILLGVQSFNRDEYASASVSDTIELPQLTWWFAGVHAWLMSDLPIRGLKEVVPLERQREALLAVGRGLGGFKGMPELRVVESGKDVVLKRVDNEPFYREPFALLDDSFLKGYLDNVLASEYPDLYFNIDYSNNESIYVGAAYNSAENAIGISSRASDEQVAEIRRLYREAVARRAKPAASAPAPATAQRPTRRRDEFGEQLREFDKLQDRLLQMHRSTDPEKAQAAKELSRQLGITVGYDGPPRFDQSSRRGRQMERWFRDSVVSDGTGKPRRMVHVTNAPLFETFRTSGLSAHFGTVEAAADRQRDLTEFSEQVVGRDPGTFRNIEVYLRVEDPLEMPDLAGLYQTQRGEILTRDEAMGRLDEFDQADPDNPELPRPMSWESDTDFQEWLYRNNVLNTEEFFEVQYNKDAAIALLKEQGYDGIEYINEVESPGSVSYIIFDANQAKHADVNTTFDIDQSSMFLSRGMSDEEGKAFGEKLAKSMLSGDEGTARAAVELWRALGPGAQTPIAKGIAQHIINDYKETSEYFGDLAERLYQALGNGDYPAAGEIISAGIDLDLDIPVTSETARQRAASVTQLREALATSRDPEVRGLALTKLSPPEAFERDMQWSSAGKMLRANRAGLMKLGRQDGKDYLKMWRRLETARNRMLVQTDTRRATQLFIRGLDDIVSALGRAKVYDPETQRKLDALDNKLYMRLPGYRDADFEAQQIRANAVPVANVKSVNDVTPLNSQGQRDPNQRVVEIEFDRAFPEDETERRLAISDIRSLLDELTGVYGDTDTRHFAFDPEVLPGEAGKGDTTLRVVIELDPPIKSDKPLVEMPDFMSSAAEGKGYGRTLADMLVNHEFDVQQQAVELWNSLGSEPGVAVGMAEFLEESVTDFAEEVADLAKKLKDGTGDYKVQLERLKNLVDSFGKAHVEINRRSLIKLLHQSGDSEVKTVLSDINGVLDRLGVALEDLKYLSFDNRRNFMYLSDTRSALYTARSAAQNIQANVIESFGRALRSETSRRPPRFVSRLGLAQAEGVPENFLIRPSASAASAMVTRFSQAVQNGFSDYDMSVSLRVVPPRPEDAGKGRMRFEVKVEDDEWIGYPVGLRTINELVSDIGLDPHDIVELQKSSGPSGLNDVNYRRSMRYSRLYAMTEEELRAFMVGMSGQDYGSLSRSNLLTEAHRLSHLPFESWDVKNQSFTLTYDPNLVTSRERKRIEDNAARYGYKVDYRNIPVGMERPDFSTTPNVEDLIGTVYTYLRDGAADADTTADVLKLVSDQPEVLDGLMSRFQQEASSTRDALGQAVESYRAEPNEATAKKLLKEMGVYDEAAAEAAEREESLFHNLMIVAAEKGQEYAGRTVPAFARLMVSAETPRLRQFADELYQASSLTTSPTYPPLKNQGASTRALRAMLETYSAEVKALNDSEALARAVQNPLDAEEVLEDLGIDFADQETAGRNVIRLALSDTEGGREQAVALWNAFVMTDPSNPSFSQGMVDELSDSVFKLVDQLTEFRDRLRALYAEGGEYFDQMQAIDSLEKEYPDLHDDRKRKTISNLSDWLTLMQVSRLSEVRDAASVALQAFRDSFNRGSRVQPPEGSPMAPSEMFRPHLSKKDDNIWNFRVSDTQTRSVIVQKLKGAAVSIEGSDEVLFTFPRENLRFKPRKSLAGDLSIDVTLETESEQRANELVSLIRNNKHSVRLNGGNIVPINLFTSRTNLGKNVDITLLSPSEVSNTTYMYNDALEVPDFSRGGYNVNRNAGRKLAELYLAGQKQYADKLLGTLDSADGIARGMVDHIFEDYYPEGYPEVVNLVHQFANVSRRQATGKPEPEALKLLSGQIERAIDGMEPAPTTSDAEALLSSIYRTTADSDLRHELGRFLRLDDDIRRIQTDFEVNSKEGSGFSGAYIPGFGDTLKRLRALRPTRGAVGGPVDTPPGALDYPNISVSVEALASQLEDSADSITARYGAHDVVTDPDRNFVDIVFRDPAAVRDKFMRRAQGIAGKVTPAAQFKHELDTFPPTGLIRPVEGGVGLSGIVVSTRGGGLSLRGEPISIRLTREGPGTDRQLRADFAKTRDFSGMIELMRLTAKQAMSQGVNSETFVGLQRVLNEADSDMKAAVAQQAEQDLADWSAWLDRVAAMQEPDKPRRLPTPELMAELDELPDIGLMQAAHYAGLGSFKRAAPGDAPATDVPQSAFEQRRKDIERYTASRPEATTPEPTPTPEPTTTTPEPTPTPPASPLTTTPTPDPSKAPRFVVNQRQDTGKKLIARTRFAADGRATIEALTNPQATFNTIMRGLSSIARRELSDSDMDALVSWCNTFLADKPKIGHKNGRFIGDEESVEQSERYFSQAVLMTIRDKDYSPRPRLAKVFERFRAAMNDVTETAKGVGVIPSEPVRKIIERAFTGEPEKTPVLSRISQMLGRRKRRQSSRQRSVLNTVMQEARRAQAELLYGNQGIRNATPINNMDDLQEAVAEMINQAGDAARKSETPIQIYVKDADSNNPVQILGDLLSEAKGTLDRNDLAELQGQLDLRINMERDRSPFGVATTATQQAITKEDTPTDIVLQRLSGGEEEKAKSWARKFGILFFGGDALLEDGLRLLPPEARKAVLAGTRLVEQAFGEAIRLVRDGSASDEARDLLNKYLGGETVSFSGGREVLSSGYNMFEAVMEGARKFLADGNNNLLNGKSGEVLNRLAYHLDDPRLAGKRNPGTSFSEMLARNDETGQMISNLVKSVFEGENKTARPLFVQQALTAVGAHGKAKPRDFMFLEALAYYSGVTKRRLKADEAADTKAGATFQGVDAQFKGRPDSEKVQAFLDEVTELYDAGSAARVAVLIAGHGQSRRALDTWSGLGIAVEAKTYEAFQSWVGGAGIEDPKLRAKVAKLADRVGLNATFENEQGLYDVGMQTGVYIPTAARKRMAAALQRGNLVDDNQIWYSADTDPGGYMGWLYRYMKKRMTRGNFVLRQRYFTMNSIDHFMQLAMTPGAGFETAMRSTARLTLQNVMVSPGVAKIFGLLQKAGAFSKDGKGAMTRLRRKLSDYGDRVANFLSSSKWRIEVNKVMEGHNQTVNLGGRVYAYHDIRQIAVEEGIFSSFDTSQLAASVKREFERQQAALDRSAKKGLVGSNFNRVMEGLEWVQQNVEDTAEAWGERERIGAMITLMEQGYDPRTAARITIDALYDYAGSMSKGDRHFIVNIMLPFWAFQKNANRAVFNNLFSPVGGYKMGVLRRAQEYGTEALTEVAYASVYDPYGVDTESLPEDMRQSYFALRKVIEFGYGSIDEMQATPQGRELLAKLLLSYNYDVADVDALETADIDAILNEDQIDFIENGYGGPEYVPEEVRMVLNAIFRARPRIHDKGRAYTLTSEMMATDGPYINMLNSLGLDNLPAYTMPSPDKAGQPSYRRDRPSVRLSPRMTESVREYYKHHSLSQGGHSFMELFMPESTIFAGMKWLTNMATLPAMGVTTLGRIFSQAVADKGEIKDLKPGDEVPDSWNQLDPDYMGGFKHTANNLVDMTHAPVPAVLMGTMDIAESDLLPTRVHPSVGWLVEDALDIDILRMVPGETDMFLYNDLVARGTMTEDEARRLANVKQDRYYLPAGAVSFLFNNSPIGELNRAMLTSQATPLEEAMGLQPQAIATKALRGVTGFETAETRPFRQATVEEPKSTIPTSNVSDK